MSRLLDFYSPQNFKLMASWTIPERVRYYDGNTPIYWRNLAPVTAPVIFDKRIILVRVVTAKEGDWYYAGRIQQILRLAPKQQPEDPEDDNVNLTPTICFGDDPKSLWLSKPNLIIFDSVETNYQVEIKLPRWFRNAFIEIHQYDGVDTSELELDILAIKSHLGIS